MARATTKPSVARRVSEPVLGILALLGGCILELGSDDLDGDGHTTWEDCDDLDPNINPDATEVCDGVDNNCDGRVDGSTAVDAPWWFEDRDGDGYGSDASGKVLQACAQPPGLVGNASDCDDGDPRIRPGAVELCNDIDDDCDEEVDEDVHPGRKRWFEDLDRDGFGNPEIWQLSCDDPGTNWVDIAMDCQDVGPFADDTYPGAAWLDSETECQRDADGDGWGSALLTAPGVRLGTDCDDHDRNITPAALELCNGLDDDCNGLVDDDPIDQGSYWPDLDGDGYGDPDGLVEACDRPDGYVTNDYDNDDTEPYYLRSCLQVLQLDPAATTGLELIDPDGLEGSFTPVVVLCDQDIEGGGWTLLQRSVWDWGETQLLYTDYYDWRTVTFGPTSGAGAYRLAGRLWPYLDHEQDHLVVHHARDLFFETTCAPLYYLGTGGAVIVSSTGATIYGLSSTVDIISSTGLSTMSSGSYSSCAQDPYYGIPWFYQACCDTCPALWGAAWDDEPHPMASYLDDTPDHYGRTTADACPSGWARMSHQGHGSFQAVDVMEYYIR